MDVTRTTLFGFLSAIMVSGAAMADAPLAPVPGGPAGVSALFADAARPAGFNLEHQPDVMRSRFVTLDPSLLDAARDRNADGVVLNLFPDVAFHASFVRADDAKYSDYVWVGTLTGEPGSSVALAVNGRMVVGEVNSPEHGSFMITYAGDGVHGLHQIDGDALDPCATGDEQAVVSRVMSDEEIAEMARSSDSGELVDIVVFYTPATRNFVGSDNAMLSAIDSFISQTNASFVNSDVHHRVRLVHAQLTNYTEATTGTNPMSTDLGRLRSTNDGHMDEVHAIRNQYGADMVHLVSMSTGACGIAYLMTNPSVGFASSAFGVTRYTCGGLTFAHELGHNKGSNHDHQNASSGAYCYSFGYRVGGVRTIMAYAPGTRIAYWSNPNTIYNGNPLGISGNGCPSDAADNVRSLNNTAIFVANWRKSVVGNPAPESFDLNLPVPGAVAVSTGASFNWNVAFYANSYELTVSKNSDLSDPVVVQTGINGSSHALQPGTLQFFTEYYWSVKAIGFGGETVANQGVLSFRTRSQADINGDGVVNFSDLGIMLGQFGQVNSGLAGDINGDGRVDFDDLAILLGTFGQGS